MTEFATSAAPDGHVPLPPSERGGWLVALVLGTLGVAVLVAALTGLIGSSATAVPSSLPPAVPAAALTPAPSPAQSASVLAAAEAQGTSAAAGTVQGGHGSRGSGRGLGGRAHAAIVAQRPLVQQNLDATRFVDQTETQVATRWMEGFYPIYATAQSTFGVNWLLLASIHRQESAFSTDPTTYHGLNFAHCCGGPMQFNVTNGPVTTWQLVSDSYRYGRRPVAYDHMTSAHPSIYDDFDSIMAAAHLLSADGAELALNGAAWVAAYDYYGHDTTGVAYADEVLARAIEWSQHGFCINCGVSPALIEAVHAAYGAPVLHALTTATAAGVAGRKR
jgi:hypothetical protein